MRWEERRVSVVGRVAVCVVALAGVGCGPVGDDDGASGPPTAVSPTPVRIDPRFEGIATVSEAVEGLERTIQDVYHLQVIDSRDGLLLLERAEEIENAYKQGNITEAFAGLQEAHAFIDASVARGHPSSEEGAGQLHQSINVMGALIAANPP